MSLFRTSEILSLCDDIEEIELGSCGPCTPKMKAALKKIRMKIEDHFREVSRCEGQYPSFMIRKIEEQI